MEFKYRKIQHKKLPAPTDLTENPHGNNLFVFCKAASQKSVTLVPGMESCWLDLAQSTIINFP